MIYTPLRDVDGQPTDRLVLNTICFHTFILMNLFNQINCRVVDGNELNVFKTLFNNIFFWMIFVFEAVLQVLMVQSGNSQLGSALLGTAPMTTSMQITCWVLGALSLVVNIGLKKIPLDKFQFMDDIDIETEDRDQFINRYMNRVDDAFERNVSQFGVEEDEDDN